MPEHHYERDGGTLYPVKPGDIWRVAEHTVCCGDLMLGAGQEALDRYGPMDLSYCDPPWNAGNARSFRTKAGLNDGPVDFSSLITQVAAVVRKTPLALVEMGVQGVNRCISILEAQGAVILAIADITYYRTRPCRLIYASFGPHGRASLDFNGMDDEDTPFMAARHLPGTTLFDPTCGRGLSGQAAVAAGRTFLGVELHPSRVSVTLRKLAEATGETPALIDRLACMEGVTP